MDDATIAACAPLTSHPATGVPSRLIARLRGHRCVAQPGAALGACALPHPEHLTLSQVCQSKLGMDDATIAACARASFQHACCSS